jgi:hypothetical protein
MEIKKRYCLEGIKIENKIEGIRIEIEADGAMQESWSAFFEKPFLQYREGVQVPEGLFIDIKYNPEEYKIYYGEKSQAVNIITMVVLCSKGFLKDKVLVVWRRIYELSVDSRKLYSKAVLKKDEKGKYKLKTIFLAGDETTGLLYNL